MIDHASVSVSDPAASKAFYEAALAPLGYRVVMEFGPVTGLGGPTPGAPEDAPVHADLWLAPAENPTPCHIAVTASSTAQVDAFHEAALAAGGTAPGVFRHSLLELSSAVSVSIRCYRLYGCFAVSRRVGRGNVEESHAKGDYLQRDTRDNLPQLSRYETEGDKQVTNQRDNSVSELTNGCPLLTSKVH